MVWTKLENFQCPTCPSGSGQDWVCAEDGSDIFINEKGVMECEDGLHSGNVCNWGWNCGSEYHKGRYYKADYEGFVFAISQALQLTDKMGAQWVADLVRELGRQYGKW
ncbi:hypothetical protein MAR_002140 [Mya arenaria]|uniref:Uncharacterized protein n=2 Tax=Mya arenaria TaxID=6604 RepID=A0ABY7FDV3_MYAAR|nr:hypothetical protein MAR_002140 [Mya arenaria]